MRQALAHARAHGLFGPLSQSGGMAHVGALWVYGPDAAAFLHSQTTHDVAGLEVGDGQLNARVKRTGHLLAWFSLHRVAQDRFLLVLPAAEVEGLRAALDAYLFADQLSLEVATLSWHTFQGPKAPEAATRACGSLGFETFSQLPEGAVRPLRRLHSRWSVPVPEGAWVLRRTLTGDPGFLFGLPSAAPQVVEALNAAATEVGLSPLSPALLEALRIEAGQLRLDVDCVGKQRLLPETGLERHTVSYSKGCYLGQEVIARVRTYGSVQHALRVLVLGELPLAQVPAPGSPVQLVGRDKPVGSWGGRATSVVAGGSIALAFLARDVRAPGTSLQLQLQDGPHSVRVEVPPLHEVPDEQARAPHLYDRAIRVFASGDVPAALGLLEQCLRLDSGFGDAYEAIGLILGRAGKYHEAIDFFRRLEEVAPDEPLVHTNLSLFYMKLGDTQTAEAEAARVVEKQFARAGAAAGHTPAEIASAQSGQLRRDAERKRGMFAQVLDFDPADPIALFGMGSALSTLELWPEAAEVLARASNADRNNSAVYLARGKALEQLDRVDEALAVYRAGIEVASRRGDLMPLQQMNHRTLLLS